MLYFSLLSNISVYFLSYLSWKFKSIIFFSLSSYNLIYSLYRCPAATQSPTTWCPSSTWMRATRWSSPLCLWLASVAVDQDPILSPLNFESTICLSQILNTSFLIGLRDLCIITKRGTRLTNKQPVAFSLGLDICVWAETHDVWTRLCTHILRSLRSLCYVGSEVVEVTFTAAARAISRSTESVLTCNHQVLASPYFWECGILSQKITMEHLFSKISVETLTKIKSPYVLAAILW